MATAVMSDPKVQSLQDPLIKEKLQELRRTDNVTNIWYVLRAWLYLALVIGGTIAFYHYQVASGISFWWNVPITLLAVILIGAGQHQLTGLAHEAAHHILFKNRLANDLVSDWLCMFPMFSCTQHYRLQHLAHHQFVNDPARDPDVSQLQTSGHWLQFPVNKKTFLNTLIRQMWLPNLFRFIIIRATYNSIPTDKNPYLKKGWKPNKLAVRVGILYMLALIGALTAFVCISNTLLLALAPLALYAGIMVFYAVIPARFFHQSRVHPVIPMRVMSLMRITFITMVFSGAAWLTHLTGKPWWLYFAVLWLLPIFTSFSFFMILRQIVQHGNGDRGWLTNTRIFFVNPLINFAVFPLGQDYHLPHHLFASIPHYRLKKLHETLLQCQEYRDQAVVVEGYFLPRERPPKHPTVVDVLGPHFYHRAEEVYIDNSVLDDVRVDDRDEILRQGEEAKQRRMQEIGASSNGE